MKARRKKSLESKLRRYARIAAMICLWVIGVIVCLAFLLYAAFGWRKAPAEQIVWGTTFSKGAAESLGVDPGAAYLAMLDELKPKRLRLVAYWTEIEKSPGVLDYSDLDFQIAEAEKRGIGYTLAIGRRVPRYPECFTPDWAKQLPMAEQQKELLAYMTGLVHRYNSGANLRSWQVENEPYLGFFGNCPPLDEAFLDREIALVRSLSTKPILQTDSGELSFWWKASARGDAFGSTLYRKVLAEDGQKVNSHIIPAFGYTARANIIKLLNPSIKKVMVAELQAEPWADGPLKDKDQAYFNRTMSLEQFKTNIRYAEATGLDEVYFWGVEWWYYEKLKGEPGYWEEARQVFAKSAN